MSLSAHGTDWMKWKRKLKRRPLITYLEVTIKADGHALGRADEITIEGMHVLACEALGVGVPYALSVKFPVELKGMLRFDVIARCVACARSSNPDLHDLSLQFLDISPDAVEAIEDLISRFAR